MNWEIALICKIVEDKDIRTAIRQKITNTFFFTTIGISAWSYLVSYYKNPIYSDTPSKVGFLHDLPMIEWVEVEESIVAICDKLRSKKVYNDTLAAIAKTEEDLAADPMEGFKTYCRFSAEMSAAHTVDDSVDLRTKVPEIKTEYLRMKALGGKEKLRGKP